MVFGEELPPRFFFPVKLKLRRIQHLRHSAAALEALATMARHVVPACTEVLLRNLRLNAGGGSRRGIANGAAGKSACSLMHMH